MGYIRHHAIVVTATYEDWAQKAHAHATSLGLAVSPLVGPTINDTETFLVAPDGSKEGWPESLEGDAKRGLFIVWLNAQKYADGSSPLKWVEVQYGDDEKKTVVCNHSEAEEVRRVG